MDFSAVTEESRVETSLIDLTVNRTIGEAREAREYIDRVRREMKK